MGVSRVVRYQCDRCEVSEDRIDSLQPPDGWGAIVFVPKPQMSPMEPECNCLILCSFCLEKMRATAGGGDG